MCNTPPASPRTHKRTQYPPCWNRVAGATRSWRSESGLQWADVAAVPAGAVPATTRFPFLEAVRVLTPLTGGDDAL